MTALRRPSRARQACQVALSQRLRLLRRAANDPALAALGCPGAFARWRSPLRPVSGAHNARSAPPLSHVQPRLWGLHQARRLRNAVARFPPCPGVHGCGLHGGHSRPSRPSCPPQAMRRGCSPPVCLTWLSEGPAPPPRPGDCRAQRSATHHRHLPRAPRTALPHHPLPETAEQRAAPPTTGIFHVPPALLSPTTPSPRQPS